MDYNSNSNYSIFGSRNSASSSNIGVAVSYPQFPMYLDFCDTSYETHRATKTGKNELDVKYKVILNKNKRELSLEETGTVLAVNTTASSSFTTPGSSYIFDQRGGYSSNKFKGKVYYCKIKNNNIMIRKFVPAYKDGEVGMIDRVNNVFYSNAGTGTFMVGKIKEK